MLAAFTLIFLIVTATLWPMARHAEAYMAGYVGAAGVKSLGSDVPTLVALLVCLIPTTIGALLAAIGIAGMDRALRANIIAKSGKAVEVAGDVDTLLLDKTGTITVGNRQATRFVPLADTSAAEVGRLAALASAADPTPEGKSIVDLYRRLPGAAPWSPPVGGRAVAFTAQTRMSGVDLADGPVIRKGASDAVLRYVQAQGGTPPPRLQEQVDAVASQGATPLLVAEGNRIVGLVVLEDVLKPGIRERFDRLRRMGIRTVMVTGDNPLTAKAIAGQAGVDDYIAEATPEAKLAYIRREQAGGRLVAMMGDGTNDAPALAQADVGVAMNSGTQAAKEAGNMVDLDSDPTKLIEVVEVGKQLLMTRGALTTFSVANDVAKYFAIVPALFAGTLPWLKALDFLHLASPTSAILSAVIFNAVAIPCLIPIALRGVTYRPVGADALLRRNLLVWGLGGVVVSTTTPEPTDPDRQPPRLGARRGGGAVRRDQADRPVPRGRRRGVKVVRGAGVASGPPREWLTPSPRVLRRDPLPRGERVGLADPCHGRASTRYRRGRVRLAPARGCPPAMEVGCLPPSPLGGEGRGEARGVRGRTTLDGTQQPRTHPNHLRAIARDSQPRSVR